MFSQNLRSAFSPPQTPSSGGSRNFDADSNSKDRTSCVFESNERHIVTTTPRDICSRSHSPYRAMSRACKCGAPLPSPPFLATQLLQPAANESTVAAAPDQRRVRSFESPQRCCKIEAASAASSGGLLQYLNTCLR